MLAPAGWAGAGGWAQQQGVGGAPSGAPSNGSLYRHSGDKVGVQWSNGDVTANTEIRFFDQAGGCPPLPIEDNTALRWTVGSGVTQHEFFIEDTDPLCSYWLAHKKGGVYSAWHQVVDSLDEAACLGCA